MVTCLSSIILLCLFIYILLPLQVYSFADAPIFLFWLTSFAGWTEAVSASRKGILKGEKEAKLILIFFTLSRASVPVSCTRCQLVADGNKEGQGIFTDTIMPVICPYTLLYIRAYALPYYIYRALWPGVIFRSALPSPSSVSAHNSQDLPCLFGKMPSWCTEVTNPLHLDVWLF